MPAAPGPLCTALCTAQALAHLDLSHNHIGTRPDSETSRDGWENFKHAPLQQLTTLKLNDNQLGWDQKVFNEQVAMLKEKKARAHSHSNSGRGG